MKKEMLINVAQPEECRIAIVENGVLEELYVERTGHESYVGNIYKGRIVNIEPSIQAAFVDFGVGRNGFLHVSDVEPAYYRHLTGDDREEGGRGRRGNGRRPQPQPQQRGNRPRVVIPPPPPRPVEDMNAESQGRIMEEYPSTENSSGEILSPPDLLPPDLGDASTITVVNEFPGEETDWPAVETSGPRTDDEPPTVGPEGAQEVVTEETQARLQLPAEGSVTGEPEEAPESEVAKPRRRGRGRSRKPTKPAARKDKEAASREGAGEEGLSKEVGGKRLPQGLEKSESAEADSSPSREEDREPPRLMESAERRTTADEHGESAGSAPQGRSDISDEELSFSLRRPPQPPQVREERRPPVEVREPAALEEVEEMDKIEESYPSAGEPLDVEEEREFEEERDVPVVSRPRNELDDDDEYMPRRSGRGREGGRDDGRREGGRDGGRDSGRGRGGRDNRRGPGRPSMMGRPKPLIQDIFKKGQEVLVQVIKEGIGTKGPTLSTYISIAGRYLVLMPGLNRIGVSRKIQDDEQRRRLRDILSELKPPKGLGFIIRTAGLDRTKKELQRDLAYLSRLWEVVVRRIRKFKAPAEIYQESDMITRTIRDTFTSEISAILVDEPKAFEHAQEFLQIVMPRYANRIKLYAGSEPIFTKNGVEDEITKIHKKHVPLPNGGSIVIEQTEALVAIDVNSGNFRADNNAEETAYQMNLLAAREIGRQLRLRDLGGVIINDFIDMRDEKHRRNVERAMREAVRRDRARTKILRISQFGIIEMTRQRIRPSLKRSVFQECPHCLGSGQVKTCESMSIEVMRMVQLASTRESITQIQVRVHDAVADYLLNRKRQELVHLEGTAGTQIQINGALAVSPEFLEFHCYDNNGNEIVAFPPPPGIPHRRRGAM